MFSIRYKDRKLAQLTRIHQDTVDGEIGLFFSDADGIVLLSLYMTKAEYAIMAQQMREPLP